jgi:hypothetical protein
MDFGINCSVCGQLAKCVFEFDLTLLVYTLRLISFYRYLHIISVPSVSYYVVIVGANSDVSVGLGVGNNFHLYN